MAASTAATADPPLLKTVIARAAALLSVSLHSNRTDLFAENGSEGKDLLSAGSKMSVLISSTVVSSASVDKNCGYRAR
jgi:hypothetical protein